MRQKCYLTLANGHVLLISYKLRSSHMGSNVGQIFLTASLPRDHSISYALVCEKKLSHMGKNNGNPDLVCKNNTVKPSNTATQNKTKTKVFTTNSS